MLEAIISAKLSFYDNSNFIKFYKDLYSQHEANFINQQLKQQKSKKKNVESQHVLAPYSAGNFYLQEFFMKKIHQINY